MVVAVVVVLEKTQRAKTPSTLYSPSQAARVKGKQGRYMLGFDKKDGGGGCGARHAIESQELWMHLVIQCQALLWSPLSRWPPSAEHLNVF